MLCKINPAVLSLQEQEENRRLFCAWGISVSWQASCHFGGLFVSVLLAIESGLHGLTCSRDAQVFIYLASVCVHGTHSSITHAPYLLCSLCMNQAKL